MKIVKCTCFFLIAAIFNSCKKDNSEALSPFIGITVENTLKSQPDTIKFIASSTIPCTYTWNFGDGSPGENGETVTHIFNIGYFYVTLNAVTNANKSATISRGINASKYRRVVVNTIKLTQLPATRPDGTDWETDGTKPDVFCEISTGDRTGITSAINNADVGNGLSLNLSFSPAFSDSLFEEPLVIKIYNSNPTPLAHDLMETITLEKNLTELIKPQEPYDVIKQFQTSTATGQLGFYWAQ